MEGVDLRHLGEASGAEDAVVEGSREVGLVHGGISQEWGELSCLNQMSFKGTSVEVGAGL